LANKSNYFPRRSSHFKNYKVNLSGRGSQIQKRKNSIDHILKGVKQLVDVGIPLDEKTERGL
jgi:hypothetical protein